MTEKSTKIQDSRLYNEDLAPVPAEGRTWGTWNIAGIVHIVLSSAFPPPATPAAGGDR